MLAVLVVCSTGCMTYPYQDQIYTSRSSTVHFTGYVPYGNAPVEIHVASWPNGDCASGGASQWQLLGSTISNSNPIIDGNGNPWYQFSYHKVIPNENWCHVAEGPGGTLGGQSYKTFVMAEYKTNGKWWPIVTFEQQDYVDCWEAYGGNGYAMAIECSRVNEEDGHAVAVYAPYDP